MTYDKSLKLLNYAQTDNNNLKLYTELNHSFKLGDRLYIVGGFYDNVSGIDPNDPFSVNYYTVIDVDYNRNSFTIDYTVQSISDLTYPYTKKGGATGWQSSDPFGADAYNQYSTNEIYKHVYVSRCVFNAGIFNAGIINNGIFGTDDNTIDVSCHISNVNNTSIPTDNVKITHIVSKNIKITKGIVISKTVNANIATRKFRVVENKDISLTNNIPNNPFSIVQISVGQNNDGYGYTVLEGFKTIQTNPNPVSNILSIKNTKIDNYLTNGIILDNVTLDNCQLGSNNLMNPQHTIEYKNNIQINNSLIKNLKTNFSIADTINFNIDNSTFNNSKKVTVLKDINNDWEFNINFNGNSSTHEYSLLIDYDSLANIGDMTNMTVYLSGITNSTKPNHEFFGYSYIQNITYNYGEYDSGVLLELRLEDLYFYQTDTHLGDFDFSNVKIVELNKIPGNIQNSTFDDFALESPSPLIYNSEIKNGYYDRIIYENTNCNADNGDVVVLNSCQQLLSNNFIESESNIIYNNCHISTQLVSGIITNTYLNKVKLYESKLGSNVQLVDGSLNYVEFISNSNINIDNSVDGNNELNTKYNNVKYNYNQDVVGIHENIYPEGRKSPLVIGNSMQDLPLSRDNYAQNYNTIKLTGGTLLPTSQFLIDTDNNSYKLIYETPHYGYVNPTYDPTYNDVNYTIDPSKIISQTMTAGYNSIANPTARNFFIKFNAFQVLYNTDRTNNIPSNPTISPDFTGPSREVTPIVDYYYEIPENYLLEIDNYNYKELPRNFCYITTDFYDQSYTIDNFPDYDANKSNINNIIELELVDTVNQNSVTINNNDVVTISNPTEFNLLLGDFVDHNNVVLGNGSKVSSTFIEIEFIEITDNSGTNRSIINQIPRYNGQSYNYDQYAIDNIIAYQDFTESIKISAQNIFDAKLYNNYDQESIPFQYIPNGAFTIKIQYWITWNYGKYMAFGLNGENPNSFNYWEFSKRTRHTFEFSGT